MMTDEKIDQIFKESRDRLQKEIQEKIDRAFWWVTPLLIVCLILFFGSGFALILYK